jgi:hypothetical protein
LVTHHHDHIIVVIPSFCEESVFILTIDVGEFFLSEEAFLGFSIFCFSFTFLSPFGVFFVVEIFIVWEVCNCFIQFHTKRLWRDSFTLELPHDFYHIEHIELRIMSRFQMFPWSLDEEFANQSTSIEFLEHFHPTRANKEFRVFFINESFTKTMKS